MLEWLRQPWPWYIGGPLLGLMVPILLFLGNKHFGMSASFRHICSAVLPRLKASYFKYEWKKSIWNIVLVAGVIIGAAIAVLFLEGDKAPEVSQKSTQLFVSWGITDFSRLQPAQIFSFRSIASVRNLILIVVGGFFVGFGTRYGNGCTSGHAIMGISLLSFGSVVATAGFFAGGLVISNFVLPWIMSIGG